MVLMSQQKLQRPSRVNAHHGLVMIAALLLLLTQMLTTSTAASTTSTDPRCANYECRFISEVYEQTQVDDTTCWNGCMDTCLVGDDWDARRAELGTGLATRTFVPSVVFDDWLSAEIAQSAYRILLEEMLGFTVKGVTGSSSGFDVLCCGQRDLTILERWPQDDIPDDEEYFSLSEVSTGYEGGSGIYVSAATFEQYPLSTAYNAYKYLANYSNIYPRAFTTPCENASVDPSLGCVDGNYFCDTNDWTNTTCTQGRYVPPVCQADPSICQELYHVIPEYESGFFEGLIKNTGLKFVIVYVGLENLQSIVVDRNSKGLHSFFYAWEPDSLVTLLNATPVTFKTPDSECAKKENVDPTLNLADCDYQKSTLTKLARKDSLQKDTDYKYFFESFSIGSTEMKGLLQQHPQGGGSLPVYNISCQWLQNNYGTWKDWIRNTPITTKSEATTATSSNLAIIVAVVVSVVVLALVVAGIYFFMVFRAKQAVKFAPKKVPFALMFTDVEKSTMLWERHGAHMEAAMDLHHSLIRELITEYQCYEVKTIGDSFMIACPTIVDCAMLSLAIQTKLYEATWPEPIKDWKGNHASEQENVHAMTIWCGLRVRIGIHYCREVEPKFDVIHKRYDYYGHDVNMSARVESMAQGGQILMTEDTHQTLHDDPDFATMIGDDAFIIRFASGVELKGVSDKMTMYSMVPTALMMRRFEPIAGADNIGDGVKGLTGDAVTGSDGSSNKSSNQSIMTVNTQRQQHTQHITPAQEAIRKSANFIFSCCETKEEREALLKKCSEAKGISESASDAKTAFHRRLKNFIRVLEDETDKHIKKSMENGGHPLQYGSVNLVNSAGGSLANGPSGNYDSSFHHNYGPASFNSINPSSTRRNRRSVTGLHSVGPGTIGTTGTSPNADGSGSIMGFRPTEEPSFAVLGGVDSVVVSPSQGGGDEWGDY